MDRRNPLAALLILAVLGSLLIAAQATVTICHHPGFLEDPFGFNVTLVIAPSAVKAHMEHGDTIGACGAQPTPKPTPHATPHFSPNPTAKPKPTPKPLSTPGPNATFLPPHLLTPAPSLPTIPATDTGADSAEDE